MHHREWTWDSAELDDLLADVPEVAPGEHEIGRREEGLVGLLEAARSSGAVQPPASPRPDPKVAVQPWRRWFNHTVEPVAGPRRGVDRMETIYEEENQVKGRMEPVGMSSGEKRAIQATEVAHGSHIGSSEGSYGSACPPPETLGPPKASVGATLVDMPGSGGYGLTSTGTDPSEQEEGLELAERRGLSGVSGLGQPRPSDHEDQAGLAVKESARVAEEHRFISSGHTAEGSAAYNVVLQDNRDIYDSCGSHG